MSQDLSQQVLDAIQSGFPLEADPYAVLAQRLGADPADVRQAIEVLYASGQVRRIGASFDSRKLGYTSTLCALAVPGGEVELQRAADIVSAFPGVTHNYGRAHRYNLWFTLITRSTAQKAAILDAIRTQTGCNNLLDMPSTRKFKISVDFSKHKRGGQSTVSLDKPVAGSSTTTVPREHAFNAGDPFDIELVRWAQADIARDTKGVLYDDPFMQGAEHIATLLGREDITAEKVIARLQELKATKTIRRFGAMVRHHKIGFAFNSMTVWDIPDDEVNQAGELFATAPFVSHCYTRPRAATWPANLYAMTHAQSEEELQANIATLQQMLETAGITCNEHFALETTAEYKKVSMQYFMEDASTLVGNT